MKNKTLSGDNFAEESTENLMLISALAEPQYRKKALTELNKRRLLSYPEQVSYGFTAQMGLSC